MRKKKNEEGKIRQEKKKEKNRKKSEGRGEGREEGVEIRGKYKGGKIKENKNKNKIEKKQKRKKTNRKRKVGGGQKGKKKKRGRRNRRRRTVSTKDESCKSTPAHHKHLIPVPGSKENATWGSSVEMSKQTIKHSTSATSGQGDM